MATERKQRTSRKRVKLEDVVAKQEEQPVVESTVEVKQSEPVVEPVETEEVVELRTEEMVRPTGPVTNVVRPVGPIIEIEKGRWICHVCNVNNPLRNKNCKRCSAKF